MRRLIFGMLVVAALILGAGYTYTSGQSGRNYLTAPLERGNIATFVKATGSVEPVITVDVSSQLSGRISEVFVNFNDQVKRGQPIARVDPEIFAARANEARA